jgi:hypothetical protein
MTRSVDSAADFVRQLTGLAGRLAALDLVVAQLHCDWSSFGSWSLDVQKGDAADRYSEALSREQWDTCGPDVVSFSWDGRERILTLETSPTPPLSAPNRWERQLHQAFDSRQAAFTFVEEYLARWAKGDSIRPR